MINGTYNGKGSQRQDERNKSSIKIVGFLSNHHNSIMTIHALETHDEQLHIAGTNATMNRKQA